MPTLLLPILVIVLWLFVLAPLAVNTRESIRRTSDALGKTHVLHRGGEELATTCCRLPSKESDVRIAEEVDNSLETVNAQVDDGFDISDVLIDDTVDEVVGPTVVDGDIVCELEAADVEEETPQADSFATEEAAAEYSSRSDVGMSGSGSADRPLRVVVGDEGVESDSAVASTEGDVVRTDESSSSVSINVHRQFVDVDDLMSEDAVKSDAEAFPEIEEAAGIVDGRAVLNETVEDGNDHNAESNDESIAVDDTLTEDDCAFVKKRCGRGGFDSVSDAQYTETRFTRCRRSVAGLAAFTVVTTVIAAFAGGWTWWISLVDAGLMTLYLINLRRTVHAEQEPRARRICRMKMARLGICNHEDSELGTLQRLCRLGVIVVELDDEDPDFADPTYTDYHFDDDDYDEVPQTRVS